MTCPFALFCPSLDLQVPVSYTWSPALVERPNDWPDHCRVTGFVHVPLKSLTEFQPPQEWKVGCKVGVAAGSGMEGPMKEGMARVAKLR